ncbi:signal peptidase II [Candidatus Dojkabacteria bacterium]|uniref:Signal peptidase II n=1 Tax=Candidatus Dojkabacteria bacterium TaxID=2099670 RepID=A0A955I848_9BACT|nr:signal peptidase II [Candidatus Dojkabacteria bacterium]
MTRSLSYFSVFAFGIALSVLDQLLKHSLPSVQLNKGGVLGLALPGWVLIILHLTITCLVCLWVYVHRFALVARLLTLVLVVAMSNLLDRILWGQVVDYLQIAGVWFNLADVTIDVGMTWVAILLVKNKKWQN